MNEPDDIDRRLARVPMHHAVVNDIFTGGAEISADIPDDARVVRTFEHKPSMTFYFVFKSKEFDIVDEGDVIPEMDVDIHCHPERREFKEPDGPDGLSYSYDHE